MFNTFYPDIEGVYTQSIQGSSIGQTLNKRWELTIKHDSGFIYTIHERYSATRLDSTYRATGKWNLVNDTLTLKTYSFPYLFEFVVKGDKLIPIGKTPVRRGSIQLDYLLKDPS